MPDTKRLPQPENTKPYQSFVEAKKTLLLNARNIRNDGRDPLQHRPIFLRSGVIHQAKGSAYIECGKTKIMCAVYGPREVMKREDLREVTTTGQLTCEVKVLTFSSTIRTQHQPDRQQKDISITLREALESAVRLETIPRSRIDVYVTIIENDGCCLASAITAASLALSTAGVEMYDLVIGASVRRSAGHLLLDPSGSEEYDLAGAAERLEDGQVTIGVMPTLKQVTCLVQQGWLESPTASKMVQVCLDACDKLLPVAQQALLRTLPKPAKDTTT